MRFMGGKTRIADDIAKIIKYRGAGRSTYVEPFLGGGSSAAASAPHFEHVHLSDAHEDLALLWKAMLEGWVPPHHLTRSEWEQLKTAEPSALRGFAGYGVSFGGTWFKSYAADNIATGNHYACASTRSLQRKASRFAHATVRHADYSEAGVHAHEDAVIYCDPPYAGTYPYKAVGRFDSESFWQTAQRWTEAGALVLVSEYTAPPGWTPIWQRDLPTTMNQGADAGAATERLFLMEPS